MIENQRIVAKGTVPTGALMPRLNAALAK